LGGLDEAILGAPRGEQLLHSAVIDELLGCDLDGLRQAAVIFGGDDAELGGIGDAAKGLELGCLLDGVAGDH